LDVVSNLAVTPVRIQPPEKAAITAAGFSDARRDAAARGKRRRPANVLDIVF
jgi:hypothetical protein